MDLSDSWGAEANTQAWKRACLDSLNIPDMLLRQKQISHHFIYEYTENEDRHRKIIETQQWLWDDSSAGPGLVSWLRGEDKLFWIRGKPGSGKSTILKNLWENDKTLEQLPDAPNYDIISSPWFKICAFFHDRGTSMQKSLTGVLSSLIYQILVKNPHLVELVIESYMVPILENSGKPLSHFYPSPAAAEGISKERDHRLVTWNWDASRLRDVFKCLLQQESTKLNILAIVDALDEHQEESRSNEHIQMISIFKELSSCICRNVRLKIIVSSRLETVFEDSFEGNAGFLVDQFTRPDIEKFIRGKLGVKLGIPYSDNALQRAGLPSKVGTLSRLSSSIAVVPEDRIETSFSDEAEMLLVEIADRAMGVFLWVELVIQELLNEWNRMRFISKLREKLKELPPDLPQLYEYILKRVAPQDRRASYITLELVLRSQRNLSLLELIIMVEFLQHRHDLTSAIKFALEIVSRMNGSTAEWNSLFSDLRRILQVRCMGLLDLGAIAYKGVSGLDKKINEALCRTDTEEGDEEEMPEIQSSSAMKGRLAFKQSVGDSNLEVLRVDTLNGQASVDLENQRMSPVRSRILGRDEETIATNGGKDIMASKTTVAITRDNSCYRVVQFLHQTAKEYLDDSSALQQVFGEELKDWPDIEDGTTMFLTFCRQWLQLPANHKQVLESLHYNPIVEMLLYAPLLDVPTTVSSEILLNQEMKPESRILEQLVDEFIKMYGQGWGFNDKSATRLGPDSLFSACVRYDHSPNFLAFAITKNMRNYLGDLLNKDRRQSKTQRIVN